MEGVERGQPPFYEVPLGGEEAVLGAGAQIQLGEGVWCFGPDCRSLSRDQYATVDVVCMVAAILEGCVAISMFMLAMAFLAPCVIKCGSTEMISFLMMAGPAAVAVALVPLTLLLPRFFRVRWRQGAEIIP